jgi:hypothetical protein
MIKEAYCSFEVAKLLKEKGFDESCYQKYDNTGYLSLNNVGYINSEKPSEDFYALAPTHQMAMAWLREEKGIAIIPIISSILDNEKFLWNVKITIAKTAETYTQGWRYEDYGEVVDDALKYCLENLI